MTGPDAGKWTSTTLSRGSEDANFVELEVFLGGTVG